MIRASKHSVKFSNLGKRNTLSNFIDEYREAITQYTEFLWNNRVEWLDRVLDVQNGLLDCPSMLDYNLIQFPTQLSARALSSAATQACGMVKSALEKQRKRLFKLNELKSKGKDYSNLEKKIQNTTLIKPNLPKDFKAELSSKCCDLEEGGSFDHFLRLKSIGKSFKHIKIPIKGTKISNKWSQKGKRLNSFLVSKSQIEIRYEILATKKTSGEILGMDQGISTFLSFSNGAVSESCPHNHSLSTITKKLSKQRKGSKAHHRTQSHRLNYINWSLNQLNWSSIKQINVEDIADLGRGRKKSRFLSHFTPGIMYDRISQKSEEHGVRVNLIDCTYRSQRCSQCGWVQKSNRRGKVFHCAKCQYQDDADLNAAKNNVIDLPKIPVDFRLRRENLKGFYFNEDQEFRVPDTK